MVKSMVFKKSELEKNISYYANILKKDLVEEIDDDKNVKSLLNKKKHYITDKIYVRIPTVGEIIKDEQRYYSLVSSFTSVPYQYMVQLDDMGIDYTQISEYELFMMMFVANCNNDLSAIFGNLDTNGYEVYHDQSNNSMVLCKKDNSDEVIINEFIYYQIADILRKINNFEKCKYKPGNEHTRKYLLEKERRKLKRNSKKPYEPYLEKLVIALVNRPEFKYNYEETMNLSLYKFNQSFKQIQTSINFDNTMIGVYAGTVDTSKLKDKSCLSWIPIN